jgi:hypothetical protein
MDSWLITGIVTRVVRQKLLNLPEHLHSLRMLCAVRVAQHESMNEEGIGLCWQQTKHIHGHLWQIFRNRQPSHGSDCKMF